MSTAEPSCQPGMIYVLSSSRWYALSEKHIDRIVNDELSFRIYFKEDFRHRDPSFLISGNLPIKHELGETYMEVSDPDKNFKCTGCRIPYQKIESPNQIWNNPAILVTIFILSLIVDPIFNGISPLVGVFLLFWIFLSSKNNSN